VCVCLAPACCPAGYTFDSSSARLQSTAAADSNEQDRFLMGRPLMEIINNVLPK